MPLPYLKQVNISIPSGYIVQHITVTPSRVYVAAAHVTVPKVLAFNMAGARQANDEFDRTDESIDAMCHDGEDLYLFKDSGAFALTATGYPYTFAGRASGQIELQPVSDDLDRVYGEVRGAVFRAGAVASRSLSTQARNTYFSEVSQSELVLVSQRQVQTRVTSIARFLLTGEYILDSYLDIGVSDEVRGATLAGNRIYLLTSSELIAFDRAFEKVASDTISLQSSNTGAVAVGWNGHALVVYDSGGKLYFYGAEQPSVPGVPLSLSPQFIGFHNMRQMVDIFRVRPDGGLQVLAVGVDALKQSVIRQAIRRGTFDLQDEQVNTAIILEFPDQTIDTDDIISINTGATTDNPPSVVGAEAYVVRAFGEAGARFRQVLYAVPR